MTKNPAPTKLWVTLRRLLRGEGVDADSLSLDKLAAALGVGRGTAQRLKEGHENLKSDTITRLSDRFGVPASVFLDGDVSHPLHDLAGTMKGEFASTDRAAISSLGMHLASTIDSIKDADVKTKAFAAAVVAMQNAIAQTDDPDKSGQ